MKKFLNTMLITAAVVAASTGAYAASAGKVAQGAYVGASAGMANTNVKYNRFASSTTALAPSEVENVDTSAGKTAGIFGLLGGYNFQSGSLVFGGEVYGGLDSTKVTAYDDTGSGRSAERAVIGSVTVKRTNFFGIAPRLGFMVAPNTLTYARLGVEFGKWEGTSNPNMAALSNTNVVSGTADITEEKKVRTSSKGGISFAPGLGMEVYMGKAFVRAQYSYLFGPKITLQQNMRDIDAASYTGEFANHSTKMNQHKVELAVGYKF